MKPMQSKWLALAVLAICACSKNEPAPNAPASAEARKSIAATPMIPATPAIPAAKDEGSAAVALTPLVPVGGAQRGRPADAEPKSAREQRVEAIVSEHSAAMEAYYDLFRAAKSDEERQQLAETAKGPDAAPFVQGMRALLSEDATDKAAFDALLWLLGERTAEGDMAANLELLEKHHFAREEMSKAILMLQYAHVPAATALLERLAKQSPHRNVRGQATMAQAEALRDLLERIAEVAGASEADRAQLAQYYSEDQLAQLAKLDPAATQASAVQLYETVIRDYADVPAMRKGVLGDAAKATLNEMLNLVVGKLAPDIVGEDIAGVPFKLSDYRGKVVMLDFWGHW